MRGKQGAPRTRSRPNASARAPVAGGPAQDEEQALGDARSKAMPLVHRRKAAATAGLLLSIPAGAAELLITREWAILAGENDYTTDTFQQITGRSPRPVAEFLHEYREEFV
jgi:hypothetical protein